MRQIAYPAALGSCVLGAGASPLWAAEWSVTPMYSSSVDYDSNRRLAPDAKGSDAAILTADVLFKRALEDVQFSLQPRYSFRRFTDSSLGNGDDRSVYGAINWSREKSTLSLNASYLDQSTLVTELLETGILSADTHRRMAQAGASWNWNQTERRALIAQLTYMDVSYYGQNARLLPGYRYPMGSLGERFFLTERGSLTLSIYGSDLQSDTPGNSSHELGGQVQIIHAFSEKTNLDASIGESSRTLTGRSSHGTDASVSLTHLLSLGRTTLSYTRSLVPYGTGFLVERQQFTVAVSRPLSDFLDYDIAFLRVQNNETAVLLHLDRRNYNTLTVGLNWHPAETWSVGAQIQGIRTQLPDVAGESINSWRSSITLTWSPLPKSRSW